MIEHEYKKEKEDRGELEYPNHVKLFDETQFLLPLLENYKTIFIHLNHNEICKIIFYFIFKMFTTTFIRYNNMFVCLNGTNDIFVSNYSL